MEGTLFGFGINPASVEEAVATAQTAERLGFNRVGVWDSPSLVRETWVTLSAMAMKTSKIRLGTWVTNPVTRHPVVTASAAAALDELAPGRVVLGVGTGHTGLMGGAPVALNALQGFVSALRDALRDGRCRWNDQRWQLPWQGVRVPILMSAHGQRSLRVAARVADGIIIGLGVSPDIVEKCLALVREECESAGRRVDDLEIWWVAPWYVDSVPGRARASAAWHTAVMAHHLWRGGTKDKWVPPDLVPFIDKVGSAYELSSHGGVPESVRQDYTELVQSLGISDYLLDRFTFSGTPEEVADQVRRATKAGARCFDGAIDALPGKLLELPSAWAKHVMPMVG
jgi:5,10-methylenetetrahydromethanopterin reductase